jgi:hypothetical protein
MNQPTAIVNLVNEALEIEAQEAKEVGALGFMARSLIQATMPHSKPKDLMFSRVNGNFTLTMWGNPSMGLPYGSIPRLLMAWLTTEAVRRKSREIVLGSSLSEFMRELGIVPTGGRWGTIARLKAQTTKLFSCAISCTYADKATAQGVNLTIAKQYTLWWDPKDPKQGTLFDSSVELSEDFYREIVIRPVPVDMRALKALSKSPMAIDIYTWLTHRMSYLRGDISIPWEALALQFGSDYNRLIDFKIKFIRQLKAVHTVYPEARFETEESGLYLKPSQTHVALGGGNISGDGITH